MHPLLYGLAFVLLALGITHLVMAARRLFLIYLKSRMINGTLRWLALVGLIAGLAVGYIVIAVLIIVYPLEFERNFGGSLFVFLVLALVSYFLLLSLGFLDRLMRKVREEGERSQRFLEISGIIVLGLDQDANVTLINRKGCEILGRQEKDIVGKDWIDNFLPEENRAEIREIFRKVVAGQMELVEFHQNPVLRSDGTIRVIEWHNSTLRDPAGNVIGVLSAGNDVTERRTIEDRLAVSSEALSKTEAVAKVGHWEWDIVTGEVRWSDSLLQMGGLPTEPKPKLEELVAMMHPDDRERVIRIVEESRRKGEEFETVTRIVRSDGIMWGKMTGRFFRDSSGRVTKMIGIMMDVTELKEGGIALAWRYESEKLRSEISTSLISAAADEVPEVIERLLARIGDFLDIDGVALLLTSGGSVQGPLYLWCSERVPSRRDLISSGMLDQSAPVRKSLESGRPVTIDSVADLPKSADKERRFFEKHGVQASALVPVILRDKLVGVMGCRTAVGPRKWRKEETDWLAAAGRDFLMTLEFWEKEQTASAEREKFRTLFESLPDASLIYSPASDRFIDANPSAIQIFGCGDKDELLSKPFEDIMPAIQPDGRLSREIAVQSMRDAAAAGVASLDIVHKRCDGTEFHTQTRIIPVEYGGEQMFQGIIRDVTEERRLAKSIEDSERRYRSLVDNIADTVFSYDLSGKIFYISAQVKEFGYVPAEVVGKNIRDFIHADDIDAVLKGIKDLADGRSDRMEIEVRIRSKSGWRWTETASVIGLDDGGDAVAINGVLHDITERKQSRERLESEKSKFQEFFESLPTSGYIVSPKGKIMDINRRALSRLGYIKEEAVGMPVLNLYAPSSKKKAKALFNQFAKGESVAGEELDIVTKGGEVRTIQLSVSPVFDETGELTHSISIQRDVTDWKRAQIEKRAIETRYAELLDNVPVGIYRSEVGKNRHVLEANAAAMKIFEAESEEVFTKYDLSHFYQVKADQALFDEKLKKQSFVKGEELRLFTVKGRKIWCRLTGAITKDSKGVPVFDGMIEDITELKEASMKVRELDLLKSRFITALTHVIRTPLNKIRWSLESLSSGEYGVLSGEQQIFVRQAISSEADVLRVISQINITLDIERDTMTLDRTPMSLVSLVRSVVKQIQSEYPTADIEWTEKISGGEIPPCMIDGEKMRRAIDVLVDNAVHYLKEDDKRIQILVERKAKTIRCSVVDSGIGVPSAEQLHMFGRFFRASNAQASFPDGMGLGLYIAKSIIEAHGGTIGLKSAEGKGSTFWFELPYET